MADQTQNDTPLSAVQKFVLRAYDKDGYFSAIQSLKDSAVCGDTLLDFLLKETARSEGCDSKADALQRIRSAQRQINDLVYALIDMKPGEEFEQDGGGPTPM